MPYQPIQHETAILQPVGVAAFLSDYWEKQPLHIERDGGQNTFGLSEDAMLEKLAEQALYFPDVQLTQSGKRINADQYTDKNKKIIADKAVSLFRDGATLVWSSSHDWFPGVRRMCREIQSSLRMPCLANVYLSPSSQQGFNAHYDSHDVFIVQVSGSKTFRFYADGVTLPFNYERFDASVHNAGVLSEEIALHAGHTLYIPRGVMHDAVAANDQTSLHITFGVYTVTNKDLLQKMIELHSAKEHGLRNTIDAVLNRNDKPNLPAHMMFNADQSTALVESAYSQLQDQLAMDAITIDAESMPNRSPAPIKETDRFEVQHVNIMGLTREGEKVKLRLYGKVLEFSGAMAAAVEWLVNDAAPGFGAGALPMSQHDERVALCHQLLEESVLDLLE